MSLRMRPFTLMKGIQVAVVTPFKRTSDKSDIRETVTVDVEPIAKYAEYLQANGARGVFVNGVTGDFSVLTCDERLQIQSAWLAPSVRSKFQHVIIHIGSPIWEDLVKLGRHAVENCASAVAITFPSFQLHSPQTETHLIEYLANVSKALPEVPLLIYNIVGTTPAAYLNNLYPVLKKAISQNRVPTLVGLKYSSTNFIDAFEIMKQLNLDISIGCDEQMLAGCVMGFPSFIGSTYNIFCAKFNQVLQLMEEGSVKDAQLLCDKLFEAIRYLTSGCYKLTLRMTLNRILQTSLNVSLGDETKYQFLAKEDYSASQKLVNEFMTKYSDLIDN